MRRKIILFFMTVFIVHTAGAQWVVKDPFNLAQSIVNSSRELVEASTTAQHMIKNFEETVKIYQQNKQYYDALRKVTTSVSNARRVRECVLMVGDISDIYVRSYGSLVSDENFSARELKAIGGVYTRMMQSSADAILQLQGIVNPSDLSMTDRDRLDIVDNVHKELAEIRDLADYFSRKQAHIAYLRRMEALDLDDMLSQAKYKPGGK